MNAKFIEHLFKIRLIVLLGFCWCNGSSFAAAESAAGQRLFVVDSYVIGWVNGFCKGKGVRWKTANRTACKRAKNDVKIWGGLFISDSNKTGIRRVGEVCSRFTYELPQTLAGFGTAQFYNTFTGRVNTVDYCLGTTVMNMNVSWPGVSLGSYILADDRIKPNYNNKLFQHEYGHYLQSQRMGWAYLITVGLPAIFSKGDHDRNPVEVSCNAEAWTYFNAKYPTFKNDKKYADTLGWNYYFNPFPDTLGYKIGYKSDSLTVFDFGNPQHTQQVESLKVHAKCIDYVSWAIPPFAFIVGVCHAKKYNKVQLKAQGLTQDKQE